MSAKRTGNAVPPAPSDRRTGELDERASKVSGPFQIFMETGAVDPITGKLKMEEYETIDGNIKQRPELEPYPFLEEVYFRKNYMTPEMEDELRSLRNSDEFSEVVDIDTGAVEEYTDPITNEVRTRPVYEKQRLTTRRLNASILTLVRVVAKWDLKKGGVPVPVTVDAIYKSGMDADLIFAVLAKHAETTRPPSA